ncbi:ubiquinol cytochrome c reductase subunit 6 [Ectocarpus siliculosus]|uniref:Ubiquinol cytochrome c reductase subunit 6 n=1 Tax=Ectocarpus siliculosus TaxID=2880 RepID=D8LEI8_ECTSI|nr:ubiquinol cytochrome c reductase subunit 6 [Ectocarpus siliculosus]|eukprot:CBN80231.1 ubiquinol cytochrome c reductase subunit 6 [Ectocarpus siliculosus]
MDDDEPVDPLTGIRATCGETTACSATMSEYKACVERVTSKGFGTCEPWFFDYISCVDKCAAPKIMKATK